MLKNGGIQLGEGLPTPGSCSCWNETYNKYRGANKTYWGQVRDCCIRNVHVGHKTGTVMAMRLFNEIDAMIHHFGPRATKELTTDPNTTWPELFSPEYRFRVRAY